MPYMCCYYSYVLVMRAAPAARRQAPYAHYCSLYDVRRQPRRHQGRIMRSRVNVQIGLSVRSSRACRKRLVSRPLREALATGSLPHLQETGRIWE